jgi:tetratricopeptide (TPR) repeat protein
MAETLRKLLRLGILSLAIFLAVLPAAWLAAAAPEALAPGVKLLEAGHPEEARKLFAAYTAKNPGDADAAMYLGRAYLELHKPDTAVEWLEKAVALAPASSEKQRWLGEGYGTAAEAAGVFSAPGLAKKAKAAFDKAVILDPANLDAREDLIDFYLQAPGFMGGSVDKAKEEAAEIRKRDSFRGRVAMARVFLKQKDTAGAERELKTAVTESPNDAKARLALGQLYANGQRWPEAFDAFEAILKTDPGNWGALYQVGKTGAVSGQRLDRAEECLKRYLAHTPGHQEPPLANTHFRLGGVYEKKGDKTKARAEYQEAVRLDPKLEDAKKALEKVK